MKSNNNLKKNKFITAMKIYKLCDYEQYLKIYNLPTINETEVLKWNYILKYIIIYYHDFKRAYNLRDNHDKLEEIINYLHNKNKKKIIINNKSKKELSEYKNHKYYIDFHECFINDDIKLLRIIYDYSNNIISCSLNNAKYIYNIIEKLNLKYIKPLNIYNDFVEFEKEDIENVKLMKNNRQFDGNLMLFLFIFNLINPNNIHNNVLLFPKYNFSDGCIQNNFKFLDLIIRTIKNSGFIQLDINIFQKNEQQRYNKLLELIVNS